MSMRVSGATVDRKEGICDVMMRYEKDRQAIRPPAIVRVLYWNKLEPVGYDELVEDGEGATLIPCAIVSIIVVVGWWWGGGGEVGR